MDGYPGHDRRPRPRAWGELFVTATGNINVFRREHFEAMRDGAIMANSGHFDAELDLAALRAMAEGHVREVRENVQEFDLGGKRLHLIAEGRLVNLGAAEGHPAAVMDMSFANQALSAEYVAQHHAELEPQVYVVPEAIDAEVARLKLAALGHHARRDDRPSRPLRRLLAARHLMPRTRRPRRDRRAPVGLTGARRRRTAELALARFGLADRSSTGVVASASVRRRRRHLRWLEGRPAEGGRQVLVAATGDGAADAHARGLQRPDPRPRVRRRRVPRGRRASSSCRTSATGRLHPRRAPGRRGRRRSRPRGRAVSRTSSSTRRRPALRGPRGPPGLATASRHESSPIPIDGSAERRGRRPRRAAPTSTPRRASPRTADARLARVAPPEHALGRDGAAARGRRRGTVAGRAGVVAGSRTDWIDPAALVARRHPPLRRRPDRLDEPLHRWRRRAGHPR